MLDRVCYTAEIEVLVGLELSLIRSQIDLHEFHPHWITQVQLQVQEQRIAVSSLTILHFARHARVNKPVVPVVPRLCMQVLISPILSTINRHDENQEECWPRPFKAIRPKMPDWNSITISRTANWTPTTSPRLRHLSMVTLQRKALDQRRRISPGNVSVLCGRSISSQRDRLEQTSRSFDMHIDFVILGNDSSDYSSTRFRHQSSDRSVRTWLALLRYSIITKTDLLIG